MPKSCGKMGQAITAEGASARGRPGPSPSFAALEFAPLTNGRKAVSKREILAAFTSISLAAIALPAVAADVTSERLLNAPNEPQNWLMVHRDYNNSRHSAL